MLTNTFLIFRQLKCFFSKYIHLCMLITFSSKSKKSWVHTVNINYCENISKQIRKEPIPTKMIKRLEHIFHRTGNAYDQYTFEQILSLNSKETHEFWLEILILIVALFSMADTLNRKFTYGRMKNEGVIFTQRDIKNS